MAYLIPWLAGQSISLAQAETSFAPWYDTPEFGDGQVWDPEPLTLTGVQAGSTLVFILGVYNDKQSPKLGAPTSASGSFSEAYAPNRLSVGPDPNQAGVWYLANVSAGSHSVTPPSLASSTSDGRCWLLEVRGGPTTWTIRRTGIFEDGTTSPQSGATVTASGTVNVGDLCFAVVVADDTGPDFPEDCQCSDPPSGWTSIGAQQDTNLSPMVQASWKLATSTAAPSATWTWPGAPAIRSCQAIVVAMGA